MWRFQRGNGAGGRKSDNAKPATPAMVVNPGANASLRFQGARASLHRLLEVCADQAVFKSPAVGESNQHPVALAPRTRSRLVRRAWRGLEVLCDDSLIRAVSKIQAKIS